MLLGCIGDDFTGSSDLANTLAKQGMRATQYVGVPQGDADADVQAGVVALKSRTIPRDAAIAQSLAALEWLQQQGCQQFFFKYCSTFDSTAEGNIGPVAEALMVALDTDRAIFCPAFPGTGRSIYNGHLFVGDKLLSESGMQNHPLTPMMDPDLRRVLAAQATGSVNHLAHAALRDGEIGPGLWIVDALNDDDLVTIGSRVADHKLVTGGSGVALGLPRNFGLSPKPVGWRGQAGRTAILSGSCSIATRGQIDSFVGPKRKITLDDLDPAALTAWMLAQSETALVYSSADPDEVRANQQKYGLEQSAGAIEACFAEMARQLTRQGITRLITAGGETSGAVVEGLGLSELAIGREIDPGVPALRAREDLVLALKSGNFGGPEFFAKAEEVLSNER